MLLIMPTVHIHWQVAGTHTLAHTLLDDIVHCNTPSSLKHTDNVCVHVPMTVLLNCLVTVVVDIDQTMTRLSFTETFKHAKKQKD